MGVTIFYRGRVADQRSTVNAYRIAREFAERCGWTPLAGGEGLVLLPHEQCEPIEIVFDTQMQFSGSTKTQFAGPDVHWQVVDFFKHLQPHVLDLEVDDEAAAWDGASRREVQKAFDQTAILINRYVAGGGSGLSLRNVADLKYIGVALAWALVGIALLIGVAFLYSWWTGLL
jgi:hypothetical protein